MLSAITVAPSAEDVTSPDGSEELLVNDGGTSKKLLISNLPVGSLGANSVDSDQYVDGSIDTAHIGDDQVTAAKLANSINTEISANTAKVTNATHTGEVTGATALTIADNIVDEANLKVSNAPTNGYVLTAQSGNTGGLTWAEMTGGGPSLGTDSIIRTNAQTISENITIGSTTNGMSAGPITIADGYTVTVNGNWSVV